MTTPAMTPSDGTSPDGVTSPDMTRWGAGLAAALTLTLLTACGGGGEGSPTTPREARALFTPAAAVALQALTGAAPPGETAGENDARRRAQDRDGWAGRRILDPATATVLDRTVPDFSARHADVSLRRTILARHGLVVHGAQDAAGTVRSFGTTLVHAGLAVTTTPDGIHARTDFDASGTRPDAGATWTGLMLGADRARRALLQGDAAITYDFGAGVVDVRFAGIVNLDDREPYTTPAVSFTAVPVGDDGRWVTPEGARSLRYVEGRFAGPGHEEAAGLFWTPAMVGAFGARRGAE